MAPADRGLLRGLLALLVVGAVVGLVAEVALPGGPLALLESALEPATVGDGVAEAELTPTVTTTAPPRTASRGASPWDGPVLVVAIENEVAPERNLTGPVADALAYWNENGGYAAYDATFRLEPDAANPDIVVAYRADVDCPAHADAIGCAPLLSADSRLDRPVTVQVGHDPADNRRQVRNTAIHELGHVLGIGHCEPPVWVMAADCAGSVDPVPAATERPLAWRDATLAVHVDLTTVSADERSETEEQVGHALRYLEGGETIPANVTLRRVDDPFEADLVVAFAAEASCRDGAVVCYTHRGRDVDGDGRMDYYTAGTVTIEPGTDVEARGWYVGWAMAHQLSPGAVPAVFEDASYRERRSRWWES